MGDLNSGGLLNSNAKEQEVWTYAGRRLTDKGLTRYQWNTVEGNQLWYKTKLVSYAVVGQQFEFSVERDKEGKVLVWTGDTAKPVGYSEYGDELKAKAEANELLLRQNSMAKKLSSEEISKVCDPIVELMWHMTLAQRKTFTSVIIDYMYKHGVYLGYTP